MTAVNVNDLAERFAPLALAIAGGFARSLPHLRDDFRSDASYATFRALSSPAASAPGANLGALVRVAVRNALLDRVRREKRRPVVQFRDDGTGDDERNPLALIPGREPEPGAELEAVETVAGLLDRAQLTERQRGLVLRHFFDGEQQGEIAAERGVSRKAVSQVIGAALVKLRGAAG